MTPVKITTQNFQQEVINSDKPVLIDFWAVWCGPCSMMAPVIEQIANEHPEIKVGKVNVDEEPMLANQFAIDAIPMLMFFKDGKMAGRSVGVVPKARVEALIAR